MTRLGMVIDISRCTGCYCCFTACKDEYWGNSYPPFSAEQPKHGQSWMNVTKLERGKFPYVKAAFMPLPCMQCQNAPCIGEARDGALYRRQDGVIIIDPAKAVGQKQMVERKACPYGAIFWNEEKRVPQKCTFCVHRIEQGQIPRCVQACPSECIKFGDLDDPGAGVSHLLKSAGAQAFHSEWNTRPGVYYIDLHKMTRHFVAGAVILEDTDECAEGANVCVRETDGKPIRTKTNAFGNFEVDGLEPGRYFVTIETQGYLEKILEIDLKNSEYVGDIQLKKAI